MDPSLRWGDDRSAAVLTIIVLLRTQEPRAKSGTSRGPGFLHPQEHRTAAGGPYNRGPATARRAFLGVSSSSLPTAPARGSALA